MANIETVTLKNKETGVLKTIPKDTYTRLNLRGQIDKKYEHVVDKDKAATEVKAKLAETKESDK